MSSTPGPSTSTTWGRRCARSTCARRATHVGGRGSAGAGQDHQRYPARTALGTAAAARAADGRACVARVARQRPGGGVGGGEPPGFAYLHLTNMWHCFPHMCWSKAGRLFWLRAHGFWDARLDALGLTPRGTLFEVHGAAQPLASAGPNPNPTTRVLALPPAAHDAVLRLTPYAADGTRASSADRGHALRSAMALIHNLVVVAALVGAAPRCRLGRRVRAPDAAARAVLREDPCALRRSAPDRPCGGSPARPSATCRRGRGGRCGPRPVLPQLGDGRLRLPAPFSRRRRSQGSRTAPARSNAHRYPRTMRPAASAARATSTLARCASCAGRWCSGRRGGARARGACCPRAITLIDLPVSRRPSSTRNATASPPAVHRWHSLLQPELLRPRADDCPGAATFRRFRLACCGYFLAE